MEKTISKKTRDAVFVYGMLFLPLAVFFVFWVLVNFKSILMAFQTADGVFTLDNFKLFFTELKVSGSEIDIAIKNTFVYFAVGFFIKIPLTYLLSYFMYKKIFLYKYFRVIFFLPSIMPPIVMVSLFGYLVSPEGVIPLLYSAFKGIPVENVPIFLGDSLYATKTIVVYTLWAGFGVNMLLFNSAMARIPMEVIESAHIDGVGFFREMVSFVVPLTWSTLSTVLMLAVAGIFQSQGPILLFTQGNFGTTTIGYWIYDKVTSYSSNYEYAAAVGLFFTLVGVPITLGSRWLMNRFNQGLEF